VIAFFQKKDPLDFTPVDPLQRIEVLNIYPHDPNAFTQGLVIENGIMYEGTGLYKHSTLREVNLHDGKVIRKIKLDASLFGEGITIMKGKIYQLTWKGHRGFIYDEKRFQKLGEFNYPTEGWGITHDGKNLIVSDGSAMLRFFNPETLQHIKTIEVTDEHQRPVNKLNELEYVNGEILANVWYDNRIARIDPNSGKVTGWIDLGFLWNRNIPRTKHQVLNGIAYDPASGHIFVTGKNWPYLFEITFIH